MKSTIIELLISFSACLVIIAVFAGVAWNEHNELVAQRALYVKQVDEVKLQKELYDDLYERHVQLGDGFTSLNNACLKEHNQAYCHSIVWENDGHGRD